MLPETGEPGGFFNAKDRKNEPIQPGDLGVVIVTVEIWSGQFLAA